MPSQVVMAELGLVEGGGRAVGGGEGPGEGGRESGWGIATGGGTELVEGGRGCVGGGGRGLGTPCSSRRRRIHGVMDAVERAASHAWAACQLPGRERLMRGVASRKQSRGEGRALGVMPSELAHDAVARPKALGHHGDRFGFGHAGREDGRGRGRGGWKGEGRGGGKGGGRGG